MQCSSSVPITSSKRPDIATVSSIHLQNCAFDSDPHLSDWIAKLGGLERNEQAQIADCPNTVIDAHSVASRVLEWRLSQLVLHSL